MNVEERLARIEADITRIEAVVNVLAISKGLMCPRCGSTDQAIRKKGCGRGAGKLETVNLWHFKSRRVS